MAGATLGPFIGQDGLSPTHPHTTPTGTRRLRSAVDLSTALFPPLSTRHRFAAVRRLSFARPRAKGQKRDSQSLRKHRNSKSSRASSATTTPGRIVRRSQRNERRGRLTGSGGIKAKRRLLSVNSDGKTIGFRSVISRAPICGALALAGHRLFPTASHWICPVRRVAPSRRL